MWEGLQALPGNHFGLRSGDKIKISIDGIGSLVMNWSDND